MTDPVHGIPSLGLNQVYFKDVNNFVYVKYGIKGNYTLGEVIETPQGFMVHESVGAQNYLLYFRGFNTYSVKLTLSRLKEKLTSLTVPDFRDLIIPQAHAQADCPPVGSQVISQMTDFTNLSASMVWNFSRNCVSGLGRGAWAATGGRVAGMMTSLWQAARNPIETAENVANRISNFITGVANFTRGMITDPRGTLQRVGQGLGRGWNSMVEVVASMPTDLKVQFICSLLGTLGVDAAIVFFTAGAGSARLAATLAQLAARFVLVARILGVVSRMSQTTRAAANLGPEKMKSFMDRLMSGGIPEDDLRHLDDITGADQRLGLGALACSI